VPHPGRQSKKSGDSDLVFIAIDALNKRVPVSHNAKYVAERVDLVQYFNFLVFLYAIIENPEHHTARIRIGTHPIENRFGLARMQWRGKNTYIRFLRAFAHSNCRIHNLSDKIMAHRDLDETDQIVCDFNLVREYTYI
jgi:hypothetical protein